MFENVLVICAGNICRSPLGEALLAKMAPKLKVTSAGLVARDGDKAADFSIELGNENGLDISEHSARKLTNEICSANDLILVMEPQHLKDVAAKFPQASGKTMLVGKWINVDVIPDPHRQSKEAFEHAYQLLEASCLEWAKRLGN